MGIFRLNCRGQPCKIFFITICRLKLIAKGHDGGVRYRGPRDLASLERFIAEQLGSDEVSSVCFMLFLWLLLMCLMCLDVQPSVAEGSVFPNSPH